MTTGISWDIFKWSLTVLPGAICLSHSCILLVDGTGAGGAEQHMSVW